MRSSRTLPTGAALRAALRIRPSNRSIPRKFLSGICSASAEINEPSPQPRSTCNGALRPKILSRLRGVTYDSGINSTTETDRSRRAAVQPGRAKDAKTTLIGGPAGCRQARKAETNPRQLCLRSTNHEENSRFCLSFWCRHRAIGRP